MLIFIGFSCNPTAKKASEDEALAEEEIAEDLILAEAEETVAEEVWLIDEHQINSVPVTSKAATPNSIKKASENSEEQEIEEEEESLAEIEEEEYEIASMEAIDAALVEQEYEAMETVEVTEVAIPIEETQTIVSYGKKGQPQAAFQVVSSGPDNEVEQIIFTDKKHTDVYDVQAGMSGKEVKRLRKEMKHMVKKGQVFLYDDESNIMYLMDAQDMAGDEVTAADVESMDVQAVIWKDKKHHKKK
jgi:hypothetical protein